METLVFKEHDFKETFTGFVFRMKCENAQHQKFRIEALPSHVIFEEINVVTKAKDDTFEIHRQPFDGRVIFI